MTRIVFVGAPVDATAGTDPSHKVKFERTGHNTGNLLIGCSLRRQLVCSSYRFGTDQNHATLDTDFDLIAIPAANFIFKGFDFGYLADFIEKSKLPVLIAGLGAQLPSVGNSEIDIPEGSKRFLKVVSERAAKIGVRGNFTADVLSRLGIKNVTVTGCPSLYWSLTPELQIRKNPYRKDFNLSLNGSRNVTQHSFSAEHAVRVEGALLRLSLEKGYDYVLQNEFPEMDILYNAPVDNDISYQLRSIAGKFDLNISPEEYASRIRKLCKVFFSVEGWADYIRTKDFSLGTRFHGNMIALQNGVPAVVIAHDSRTTEMCEFMKIPYHPVDRCDLGNLEKLYNEADFSAFSANYKTLFANYCGFLEENGVKHCLSSNA